MKMAGPDIILFVIGALLFAGAGYGLVATGGNLGGTTSALGVFDVTYTTSESEVGSKTVAGFSGQNVLEFDADKEDIVTMTVAVACTDPAAAVAPFRVVVKVEGPNGLKGEGDGTCGSTIEVPVAVSDVPPATSVQAQTEQEAHENLEAHHNTTAVGKWTVTINGARGSVPPGVPAGNPSGSVTLIAEQWAPKFSPVNA